MAGQDATPAVPAGTRAGPSGTGPRAGRSASIVTRGDLLGLLWVVASGIALLVPELVHGRVLGPFYLLSRIGLTKQSGVPIPSLEYGDLIDSLIPWTTVVWHQVHQGHLPLWNPYGGLGMPLAFNWQSAPFSLSSIVGYLSPVRYAFTVGALVDIVVAGFGAYVLGRVLGMGVIAAAAVGTVFELSGPITAWLGYPFPSVMSWAGWIFALGLLLLRGRHRAGLIVGLAACVAMSLYGGAPEGFTVLMAAAVVFFAVMLITRAGRAGGSGPILRPAVDLVAATIAGVALAAPFALPGLQLTSESVRSKFLNGGDLPPHTLLYLAFQGFDGLPLVRNGRVLVFGYSAFYSETAMYVGVGALALAGLAVVVHRRRRAVQGFVAVTIVCIALVFVPPVVSLAYKLPVLNRVDLIRAVMPMALALAVLAGYGIDLVVRAVSTRDAGRRLGTAFGIAAVGLAALWIFGRGHLVPDQATIRAHSFIWPVVETAVGLGAAGFLFWVGRQRQRAHRIGAGRGAPGGARPWIRRWSRTIAGLALLAVQTAFLVSAGATMLPSSSTSFPQTPATDAFVRTVGSATVAFGNRTCLLGIAPNDNGVYGVHELGIYDPIIPEKYFTSWPSDAGTWSGNPELNLFCPVVDTVAVAREFGVGYVLEARGVPGPVGSVYVRQLGEEDLYRIPGSGDATVAPLRAGALPPADVVGTPVTVGHPSPSRWQVTTSSDTPQVLRLHLSDVPGWHATIDGEPLPLESYAGMMLQARIPAGVHTIDLHYWPQAFTAGIVSAGVSVVFLVALLVASSVRKRRRSGAGSVHDALAPQAG